MSGIEEFLLARIADDEETARVASPSPWQDCGTSVQTADVWPMCCGMPEDGEHITLWQPSRVLAECAAKRLVVRELAQLWESGDCFTSTPADECPPLRALAACYEDHPDFNAAWAAS